MVPMIHQDLQRNRLFESLCAPHREHLLRYALWRVRDREAAEDVVQITFWRAWRSIHTLADERAARPWLTKIVRRELARLYARKRLETEDINEISSADEMAICAPVEPDPSEVTSALQLLSVRDRTVLVQTLEGYSVEEMARLGGCDKKLVYVRLFRARKRLRAIL